VITEPGVSTPGQVDIGVELGTLSVGFTLVAAVSGEDIDLIATPECFIDVSFGVPTTSKSFSATVGSVGFGGILVSTTPETRFFGGVVARPEEFDMFASPPGPGRVAAISSCLGDPLTSLDGFGLVVSPGHFADSQLATPADFGVVPTSEGVCLVHISDVLAVVNPPG
jgi:hypothetical protein